MTRTRDDSETLPRADSDADTVRLAESIRSHPPPVRIQGSIAPADGGERYQMRDVIGEGGMGEIRLCRDRRIGREVAIKVIREDASARADAVVRFEREARVQGQLEHPSIVPVYDLAVDADGRSFFTMKRLRGRTLAEVLDGLRSGDAELEAEFSQRRLLTAFSQLCWAVAFAHSRGVLHRDIKPQNVMFGDFGEVHLLDWGIATVIEDLRSTGEEGERRVVDASIESDHKTLIGEMVGTPGYMSPEQIEGDPSRIDERADVFGLGAVLFEILTLEPLVSGTTLAELMKTTLAGVDARTSERAPDRAVPPELERVCVLATAALEERIPSARELREAIDHYLDGDRDVAKRRELAEQRIAAAEDVTSSPAEGDAADENRSSALRDLAAALALDPENRRAQELLGRLLIDGPTDLPAKAREALEAERTARRFALRKITAAISLIFVVGTVPPMVMGIRDWKLFAIAIALNLSVPVVGFVSYFRRTDRASPILLMVSAMAATSVGSFIVGPLILVPSAALAVANVASAIAYRPLRPLALPLGAGAMLVPMALQFAGVLPESYVFEDGMMKVVPVVTELPKAPTIFYLTSLALAGLVLTVLVVMRQQRMIDRLEERLFAHAWSLKHLVPRGTDVPLPRASQPPPSARPR